MDGGDSPRLSVPSGDMGYLDFDIMEERKLREPVAVGMHELLYTKR